MSKTPLTSIKGVADAVEAKLKSLSINSAEELLDFFPKQYIDLSASVPLSDAEDGSYCLFDGVITDKSQPWKKNSLQIFNATAKSGNIFIRLVWFNQNYVSKRLEIGKEYAFFGKIKIRNFNLEMANPNFCKSEEHDRFTGICPIYPTKGIIPQGSFRNIMKDALKFVPDSIINGENERKFGLMPLKDAYFAIHCPQSKDVKEAYKRIATEKLTERIAAFSYAKEKGKSIKNRRYDKAVNFDEMLKNLPFLPTDSQSSAVTKIVKNLKKEERMNTVLCGDVGSGKTLVAAMACFFVIRNGYQAAIAAPTEILAKQHYSFFVKAFSDTGISVGLILGSTPVAEKRKIYSAASDGKLDLVIGTHAVFSDKLKFADLALAIADEQHRFGVAQRNSLVEKGSSADVLTLSATPIPRTMYIAAYGEAEFITIDRRVKGNIKTSIVPPKKRADMFGYVAKRCEETKTYVIAPKIFDAEGIESESCEELYKEISHYVPKEKIGLMHGKMKADEKSAVMEKFRDGIYRVLVATTVVEVGVDVPDATIIIITDADKFGLAALHQLRGRVGRNGDQSYCFLTSDKECDRLNVLTANDDGFKIAEEDFALRGGGEMFGLEQAGASSLKYVTAKTLKIASACAESVDKERFKDRINDVIREFSLSDVTLG